MDHARIDSDRQVDLLGVNLTLDFGKKRKRSPLHSALCWCTRSEAVFHARLQPKVRNPGTFSTIPTINATEPTPQSQRIQHFEPFRHIAVAEV